MGGKIQSWNRTGSDTNCEESIYSGATQRLDRILDRGIGISNARSAQPTTEQVTNGTAVQMFHTSQGSKSDRFLSNSTPSLTSREPAVACQPGRHLLLPSWPISACHLSLPSWVLVGDADRRGRVADNPPVLNSCLPPSRRFGKLLMKLVSVFPCSMLCRGATPLHQHLGHRPSAALVDTLLEYLNRHLKHGIHRWQRRRHLRTRANARLQL